MNVITRWYPPEAVSAEVWSLVHFFTFNLIDLQITESKALASQALATLLATGRYYLLRHESCDHVTGLILQKISKGIKLQQLDIKKIKID